MTAFRRLRARFTRWRLFALRAELRFAPTEPQRLLALTIALGAACGLAAVGFHFAIAFAERLLISRAMSAPGRSWMVWSIVSPTVGGLACGALLQYVVPGARGSGIPEVKVAYASRVGSVPLRDAVGKFIVGSLQIGSGASLGREGPTVHICAAVANLFARYVPLSPQSRRRLLPVGAAAGIAAAFNAPMAAVTFTLEEVVGTLDRTILSGVIVAAALAAVIERSVLGTHPVFDVPRQFGMTDARSLVLFAGLGVAAAGVGCVFTEGLLILRKGFRRLPAVPLWARPGLGGAVTGGLIVIAMVWLRMGGINGGGYDVLKRSLSGDLTVKVMLALCAMKLVATVFSYSSGGAGGIFAPSLFIGAMLGGAFGSLDRTLFGHPDSTLGAFALVGMGAVFSAAIRAPMTSVLIIVEMTSGYGLVLPLMIANMTAYVLARSWRPLPIYEALLAQDGVHLHDHAVLDALESLKLDPSAGRRDHSFVSFEPAASAAHMLHAISAGTRQIVFPVLDAAGHLLGLVHADDVSSLRSTPELELCVNASDLMRPPITVGPDDALLTAFELMRAEGLPELPVLDAEARVVGLLDEAAIAQAFLHATAPTS